MNNIKLSIIIPIYNVEKYLDNCVFSATNQTMRDIEIILVDDESPDNCPRMCDEYALKDKRIKVVHRKNGGLGFARNSGLEVAAGEYVTFLDSDDFVDLYTYEHLYNIVKTNALDALYYKFKRFTNENKAIPCAKTDSIRTYKEDDVKNLMLDIIASEPTAKVDHKIQCSTCTAIYRMSIITKNKVRFHSERELISEDTIFNLDFLKYACNVAFNEGEHYHYRVNPTSLTSTIRTDRIEKNYFLYKYITSNIEYWELDSNRGIERAMRLFIGSTRSAISHYLSIKNISNKNQWLKKELKREIWREIYQKYNWKAMPLYPRLFFYACYTQSTILLKILSKIKSISKK